MAVLLGEAYRCGADPDVRNVHGQTVLDVLGPGPCVDVVDAANAEVRARRVGADTRHAILAVEDLFFGTVDAAEVHPRERALLLNASAVVAFHSHPSGNPEPSAADRAITARIKQALSLVEVRLLDHIVVSAEGYTSLAMRGWV